MAEATTSATSEIAKKSAGFHLEPLDGLRFFAALWVALHHGRKPLSESQFPEFQTLWDGTFFGMAGVLAFFVISGLCIHFPTAIADAPPRWGAFLLRRYIRVLVPYWVILPLAILSGHDYSILRGTSVAWTLFCELGFYLLYPFLWSLARVVGWTRLCVGFSLVSLPLVFFPVVVRPELNSVIVLFINLPCWLMGCVIAEKFARLRNATSVPPPSLRKLWLGRLIVIAGQAGVGLMTVTGLLYYRFLLIPLSLLIALWIWTEMRFYIGKTPSRLFAWAGTWSYSMYLMHEVINGATVPLFYKLTFLHPSIVFLANTTLILIASYVFALLVEWPSQKLARFVSKRVGF